MTQFVELRIKANPYVSFSILWSLVGLPLIYSMVTSDVPTATHLLPALLTMSLPIGYLFAAFWLYRVQLKEGILIDRGLLKFTKRVPVASIQRWRSETGWPNQRWYWRPTLRPYRRIAIYYGDKNQRKYFDISLNHFDVEKVRILLEAILVERPDLDWPKGFPRHARKKP